MIYEKFNEIYGKIQKAKNAGIPNASKHNDQLMVECIIYDILQSDKKVEQFITEAASYIEEAGLLTESAVNQTNEVAALNSIVENRTALMSTLICAKEAEDPDFELFEKSLMLLIQSFSEMKKKYEGHSEERVQAIQESILSDKRITSILDSVKKQ